MRTTKKQRRPIVRYLPAIIITILIVIFIIAVSQQHFALLDAQGTIARQQRNLLLFATILSLVIVLPVFALTFHIVRTYRVRPDGSQRAKRSAYAPGLDGNHKLETLWWTIPSIIILALSVVTWQTSHSLDPYRPLASSSDVKPLTVQVVALQWKWLFIYPDYNTATVNSLKIPVGTPVNFEITADAPMNSFWIPQLGGQVYAMTGMTSQLHLQADKAGEFRGSSANLSGEGFAKMNFTVQAVSDVDFRSWLATVGSQETAPLNDASYTELSQPGTTLPRTTYTPIAPGLFDTVVSKYMAHGSEPAAGTNDGFNQTPSPYNRTDTMEGMHHAQ